MPGRERTRQPQTTRYHRPDDLEQQDKPHTPIAIPLTKRNYRTFLPLTIAPNHYSDGAKPKYQSQNTCQLGSGIALNKKKTDTLSAFPLACARKTTTTECPKTSCNDASGQNQSRIFRRIRIPKSCDLRNRHFHSSPALDRPQTDRAHKGQDIHKSAQLRSKTERGADPNKSDLHKFRQQLKTFTRCRARAIVWPCDSRLPTHRYNRLSARFIKHTTTRRENPPAKEGRLIYLLSNGKKSVNKLRQAVPPGNQMLLTWYFYPSFP